jgi:hypothetical protein
MNITSIALDNFISAFTSALIESNYKIAEQYLAIQDEMKEKYGAPIASFISKNQALRIKKGSITVMARPVLKKEAGPGGTVDRMYLRLNGLNTREMHFEVALESAAPQ